MKIMLIEDDNKKARIILAHLSSRGISSNDVIHAKNMTDFAANLHYDIGLFIIDIKLPSLDDGAAAQNGKAILEAIIKAGKNDALLLAISSYPADFPELRDLFEANGCILADFGNKNGWQSTLDHLLVQLKKNLKLDFIIFCALQEERNPYVHLTPGARVVRGVLDCYDINICGNKGSVVLLPQMGLVNAAIIASLCIDRFKPSVVGMSGICGGIPGRASMGQLIVSSMVYEYQSGKWASDGFRQEPYQVSTDDVLLTKLKAMVDTGNLISELEAGFTGKRPADAQPPVVGIFTSGSAVIADSQYLGQIENIHRKVNAVDMEVFAVQRAAQLSSNRPPCICAKTVVDLCDQNKGNEIHSYGSHISAKFLLKAIQNFF